MADNDEKTAPPDRKPVKTHGLEMVIIFMISIVAILAVTILAYKVFIEGRLRESREYNAATYYVVNSKTLKEFLLSPIVAIDVDDLMVSERKDYGNFSIDFTLGLENGLTESLRLNVIKVADFWVVRDVIMAPETPSAYALVSTYQKILLLLENLQYGNVESARVYLDWIKQEIRDPNLYDFLAARVNAYAGNTTYAAQLLDDLKHRVGYGRLAVLFERAMIHFTEGKFDQAVGLFKQILKEYEEQREAEDPRLRARGLFAGLPKDPFIAIFSHDNIRAQTYQNMALAYTELGDFQKGLELSEKAIELAGEINSKVVRSSSLFVRALSLYKLGQYKNAEDAFDEVIADVDNTNLSQKAWAYFYKAEIASRFERPRDALDYYETAVGLDPFNYLLRKRAVEYLMDRSLSGDLEIALGLALRGLHYNVRPEVFKDLAVRLYERLGIGNRATGI